VGESDHPTFYRRRKRRGSRRKIRELPSFLGHDGLDSAYIPAAPRTSSSGMQEQCCDLLLGYPDEFYEHWKREHKPGCPAPKGAACRESKLDKKDNFRRHWERLHLDKRKRKAGKACSHCGKRFAAVNEGNRKKHEKLCLQLQERNKDDQGSGPAIRPNEPALGPSLRSESEPLNFEVDSTTGGLFDDALPFQQIQDMAFMLETQDFSGMNSWMNSSSFKTQEHVARSSEEAPSIAEADPGEQLQREGRLDERPFEEERSAVENDLEERLEDLPKETAVGSRNGSVGVDILAPTPSDDVMDLSTGVELDSAGDAATSHITSSLTEVSTSGGILRDNFFEPWKDDASAHVGVPSPEEMQKNDPLGTQIWKLYCKTRGQLPNSERLENLTWRMMSMNLRRKELERQGYVSVDF
jgi:hypothetical protein